MAVRQCYVVFENQYDDEGFIPSLVTEGEWGHTPLSGDPARLQAAWHFGKDLDTARRVCANANKDLGLTEDDVVTITASSMARR